LKCNFFLSNDFFVIKFTWLYFVLQCIHNQWRSYRAPCALGQETFLRPPPINKKLQSLKWKIGAKYGRSKSNFTVVILFIFEDSKTQHVLRGRNYNAEAIFRCVPAHQHTFCPHLPLLLRHCSWLYQDSDSLFYVLMLKLEFRRINKKPNYLNVVLYNNHCNSHFLCCVLFISHIWLQH